jgi:hypothetical protein
MLDAPRIGPRNGQRDLVIARGLCHLGRDAPDRVRRNTGNALCPLRCRVRNTLAQQREGRRDPTAVGQNVVTVKRGLSTGGMVWHCRLGLNFPPHVVPGVQRVDFRCRPILDKQTKRIAVGPHIQQLASVRVPLHKLVVERVGPDHLVDQRHEQHPIRTRAMKRPPARLNLERAILSGFE